MLLGRDELQHVYQTEDAPELRRILGVRYHVVVGNPPYITPKDSALNAEYRELFDSCHMKYSLAVPFTERFFDLCLPAEGDHPPGHVGLIDQLGVFDAELAAQAWREGRFDPQVLAVDAPDLDADGKPLPSEFFEDYIDSDGKRKQHFQQHHTLITAPGQVQIYEELTQNADGRFTTSFLRRDNDDIKDNRLLPQGWTRTGPDPRNFNGVYLRATFPKGLAASDPQYLDGSGSDVVRYEVALPEGRKFPSGAMPLSKWEKIGVTRANGKPFRKRASAFQGLGRRPKSTRAASAARTSQRIPSARREGGISAMTLIPTNLETM